MALIHAQRIGRPKNVRSNTDPEELAARAFRRYICSQYREVPLVCLSLELRNAFGMEPRVIGKHIFRGHFSENEVITPIYDYKLLEALGAHSNLRRVRRGVAGMLDLDLGFALCGAEYYEMDVRRALELIDAILEGRLGSINLTSRESLEIFRFESRRHPEVENEKSHRIART